MPAVFPSNPSIGDTYRQWYWNGTVWDCVPSPLPIVFFFGGTPGAGQRIVIPIVLDIELAEDLAGSEVCVFATPTATALFALSSSGGVTGSVSIAPDGAVSLSGSGGVVTAGECLTMSAPLTEDVSLSDVGITLFARRV